MTNQNEGKQKATKEVLALRKSVAEQYQENCHLVESNKMLLEALRDILEHSQHSIANHPSLKTAMPDIEVRAREAIAKAGG